MRAAKTEPAPHLRMLHSSSARTQFRGSFINGENTGLDEEGFAARWLELHPEDTVVMRDGTTRTA
jgi:hypothetical protein